ncbi:MAG: TIR domain-containing protein [Bacteroidales bacterium]|nr:TIR domain-containing protein [Bacteroidales bacterium]
MSEKVFISYKRVDKDRVFAIKDFIERGLGGDVDGKNYCWIDLEGIESDAQFANVIIRAINRADIFLFMYSATHSEIVDFENDWTVKEINFAQMKKKRIVFVNIDGSALSDWFALLFGTKQQVDGTDEEALQRLCNDMRKWLGLSMEGKAVSAAGGKGIGSSTKADSGGAPKVTKLIINGHEYVDLDLPSGLKWATCNVGASSQEEYGDYYAWGEIETKSEYIEDNSKTRGKSMSDISGNSTYDVARAKWGGSWRLPTTIELEELKNNCKWEWTTINGKKGYKVTGPNGNSIFLPAAGILYGSSLYYYAGERGYYWSSYPKESNDYDAYDMGFNSSFHDVRWDCRNLGQSVRPVSE